MKSAYVVSACLLRRFAMRRRQAACKLFFPMDSFIAADVHICPLTRFGSASVLGRIPACKACGSALAGRPRNCSIFRFAAGLPVAKPPARLPVFGEGRLQADRKGAKEKWQEPRLYEGIVAKPAPAE